MLNIHKMKGEKGIWTRTNKNSADLEKVSPSNIIKPINGPPTMSESVISLKFELFKHSMSALHSKNTRLDT